MDKFSEFYAKAIADEKIRNELAAIIGEKTIGELSDEELLKIGKLAEQLGISITLDEVKDHFSSKEGELPDEELEKVSGGKGEDPNFPGLKDLYFTIPKDSVYINHNGPEYRVKIPGDE